MNTKIKALVAAIGIVASTQAFAIGPTVTPDYVIYGGGGAEQNNAFEAVARSLFVPASVDTYTDLADGSASRVLRYVYGTTKQNYTSGSVTIPAGKNVLIAYRSNGGVFPNAVGAVGHATALTYYPITSASTTKVAGRYVLTGAQSISAVPDFGLSNTELDVYRGDSVPQGQLPLNKAEVTNLNQTPLYGVVNGLGVNNRLYALKTNFSKSEVASILAGYVTDWSQINGDDGNPLPSGPVVLIDRNTGSGAKAAANAYFLNNPFTPTGVSPANLNGDVGDPSYSDLSSNIIKTLSSAGNVGPELDVVESKPGLLAIGITGAENQPSATTGLNWKHVKIDGASIGGSSYDKTDVIAGKYDYWSNATFITRKAALNGARFEQSSTAHGALLAALRAAEKNATVTTTIAGVVLDPTVNSPTGAATDAFIVKASRGGSLGAPLLIQ